VTIESVYVKSLVVEGLKVSLLGCFSIYSHILRSTPVCVSNRANHERLFACCQFHTKTLKQVVSKLVQRLFRSDIFNFSQHST